jgi:putative flippase GtrA
MIPRVTKFGVVGIMATLSYYFAALSLSVLVSVFWANLVAYMIGMAVSYFGHHRFTFAAKTDAVPHRQAATRFAAASVAAFLSSQGILYLAIRFLRVPDWFALTLVVFTVPPLTFLLCQFWVFRPRASEDQLLN